jgi:hypothetical protein
LLWPPALKKIIREYMLSNLHMILWLGVRI